MLISIIRTILLYSFIILALRLMGKRQIGDLQTSELVVTLLISDIASMPMQDVSLPMLNGIVPILILIACEIVVSILMIKNIGFRRAVCGNPMIVIKNGELLPNELKRLRMSIEDLFIQLRQKDAFNIEDVQYCIVETSGEISVLKKPKNRTPENKDLDIQVEDTGLAVVVVNDGVYMDKSLEVCNKNRTWVESIIKKENIELKDIFILTTDKSNNYNLVKN